MQETNEVGNEKPKNEDSVTVVMNNEVDPSRYDLNTTNMHVMTSRRKLDMTCSTKEDTKDTALVIGLITTLVPISEQNVVASEEVDNEDLMVYAIRAPNKDSYFVSEPLAKDARMHQVDLD